MSGDRWSVERLEGPASELHAREIPDDPVPTMWVLAATGPALVLGSVEPESHADRARLDHAGIELVRRRSGGGAVLVDPPSCTWVDLVIPVGDPQWQPDVGRAMHWVGDLWRAALADLGVATTVHRGPLQRSRWSAWICFAGLGPGEVVDRRGRKVVGISQRRTRSAARFQTVAYHRSPAHEVVDLLDLEPSDRVEARRDLRATSATLDVEPAALVDALRAHLP